MSELKGAPPRPNEAKAIAHLPGLDIEIVHRRAQGEDAERISINMQAVPSFEAFSRYLEAANPFAFWAEATRLAWLPWLAAARVAMQSWTPAPLPRVDAPTLSAQEQPLPE